MRLTWDQMVLDFALLIWPSCLRIELSLHFGGLFWMALCIDGKVVSLRAGRQIFTRIGALLIKRMTKITVSLILIFHWDDEKDIRELNYLILQYEFQAGVDTSKDGKVDKFVTRSRTSVVRAWSDNEKWRPNKYIPRWCFGWRRRRNFDDSVF